MTLTNTENNPGTAKIKTLTNSSSKGERPYPNLVIDRAQHFGITHLIMFFHLPDSELFLLCGNFVWSFTSEIWFNWTLESSSFIDSNIQLKQEASESITLFERGLSCKNKKLFFPKRSGKLSQLNFPIKWNQEIRWDWWCELIQLFKLNLSQWRTRENKKLWI